MYVKCIAPIVDNARSKFEVIGNNDFLLFCYFTLLAGQLDLLAHIFVNKTSET